MQTLQDVITDLRERTDMPSAKRSELVSAVSRLCRAASTVPSEVPADPLAVRRLIERAQPGAVGISKRSWANTRSLVGKALELAGIRLLRRRTNGTLSPGWKGKLDQLPEPTLSWNLTRFAKFASRFGIEPEAVDANAFDRFREDLEKHTLLKDPAASAHAARRGWNEAVRACAAWPQTLLAGPESRRCYASAWDRFPPGLRAEIDTYVARRTTSSVASEHRPLKPHTVRLQIGWLRRYASDLVADGVDPAKLTGLATLVDPAMVERGLNAMARRHGEKVAAALVSTIDALCSMARFLDLLSADELERLTRLARRVRRHPHRQRVDGLTVKNRRRLSPLKEEAQLQRFQELPRRLFLELAKISEARPSEARRFEVALAMELLLMCPMRIANVAGLDLERHLMVSSPEADAEIRIQIPADEVKNAVDLVFVLPAETAAALQLFRRRFRPLLCEGPCSALFPGQKGRSKAPAVLSRALRKLIRRELGLPFNAHLFRHLAALFYLERHPGDYETVRRLLGHKSMQTTVSHYAGLETEAAFRRYDATLIASRDGRAEAGR